MPILYQLNNVPFKITIFQFVRLNIRNSVEQLIYRHPLQVYPVTHDILVQFLESVVSIPSVNLPLVVLSIHLYHDEKYECQLYFLISQISHITQYHYLFFFLPNVSKSSLTIQKADHTKQAIVITLRVSRMMTIAFHSREMEGLLHRIATIAIKNSEYYITLTAVEVRTYFIASNGTNCKI